MRERLRSLKLALLPGDSVAGRAVSSGIWMGISNVAGRLLQLVKLFVLARLLSPEAFGVFGIALLTTASLQWLSSPGMKDALVQKTEANVDEYLNTMFSISLLRGIILSAVVLLAAPLVADFFSEPGATDVIRAVAVAPLVGGFRNPGVMYLQKDLDFHKQFALTFAADVINVAIAIAYALFIGTVWAFVFGLLVGRIASVLGSYLIHEYRPWPEFNWSLAKEMISYGKWITASGPLLFLIGQGDDAFVGWLLGASALGLYRVAYRIGNAPGGEIAEVIKSVAFPTYSKLQDNVFALRNGYLKTIQLTMALVVPATFGIVLVARPFVDVFLGDQWLPAVAAIQLLAVYSAALAFGKINNQVMMAVGRPDINTKMQFGQLIIIAMIIYPLSDAWGLAGTAAAITIGAWIAKIPHLFVTLRELDASISEFVRPNVPPLTASVVMSGCVLGALELIPTQRSTVEFGVAVVVGSVTYVAIILLIERFSDYRLTGFLREMVDEITA